MKVLKRNQLIIFVIALMLVTAGYLNFTSNNNNTIATQGSITNEPIASIGDATLVNSNNIIEEKEVNTSNNLTNVLNTITGTENTTTNSFALTDEYFTDSRLQREKMYSQMIESYQKILENPQIGQEQKTVATKEIGNVNQMRNSIMIAENLIKTKGFKDVIIFVNTDSISIIVNTSELLPEQIAQIQNIVSRELKVEIPNIHISNK